jgi:amidase
MARNLDDLALLYGVLSGTAPSEPTGVTMVEASNWHCGHEATDALFDEVMDRLRASGVALERRGCTLPSPQDYDDELTVMLSELLDDLSEYLRSRPGEGVTSLAEVVAFEDEHRDVELRYFGHEFFLRALASGGCASENYQAARARNVEWATQDCLTPALEGVDVVLSPAYGPAWKSDLVNGDNAKFVSPAVMAAAVAGWPILTIPMGLVSGLPVGLTLVGRPQSEWTLLAAARQVQTFVAADFDVSAPTWRAPNRG